MPWLFQVIAERLRSLFTAEIALDFESHFLSQQSERKAALLRQARDYEREGLKDLAGELRQEANRLALHEQLVRFEPAAPTALPAHPAAPRPQLPPSAATSRTPVAIPSAAKKRKPR